MKKFFIFLLSSLLVLAACGKNYEISDITSKFKKEDDLKEMKKYYEELGKSSATFYSHVYTKDKFLIQMNGDIDDHVFEKYKKAMNEALN
ncbi:hypothetical protein ACP2Y1_08395 [Staphylococcus epidermidis]